MKQIKLELTNLVRNEWELKADREDDNITREIVIFLAEKELSVDRASRILDDARSMLPRLAKIPHCEKGDGRK